MVLSKMMGSYETERRSAAHSASYTMEAFGTSLRATELADDERLRIGPGRTTSNITSYRRPHGLEFGENNCPYNVELYRYHVCHC